MADTPSRPLLNPVLRFTRNPRPEGITGGGKNVRGIQARRLAEQRVSLARQFSGLAASAAAQPQFAGHVMIYAAMFEDSYAATWTPGDLFNAARGATLIAPYRQGYLIEVDARALAPYAASVRQTSVVSDMVDISRVSEVRFFGEQDARGQRTAAEMWQSAPEVPGGRAFMVWLMPLSDHFASDALLQTFAALADGVIASPPPLLARLGDLGANVPAEMRRSLLAAAVPGNRISLAMRDYRQTRRAKTTVVVPSVQALTQLVASGAIYRIEPVNPVRATSPGEGREPDRPLPADLTSLPVIGVVDGGLTAGSYRPAEAWRAPLLVRDADARHGNQVVSLIVQGHDWNNRLRLPPLYCRVGIAQAVARDGSGEVVDPQDFIRYLDAVMAANPGTRVWNLSLNQRQSCDPDFVSYLGHEIAVLARKHRVLPVISVGNRPGECLQPPADCEAALTVGGRLHGDDGMPAGACPVSHAGPGPSNMLKPDLSHFSHVRALGGLEIQGSSFATALTSPLAAHTMARLREPTPDLVKALMLHTADGPGFDPALGFGSPGATVMPWECPPGFVTLQWNASLRPGAAYYWELPIPPALRATGKLRGSGALTAVLNPHPLVSDLAGVNYFGVRLATALQYPKGEEFQNLLGSLDTDKIAEQQARAVDHKWSPVRHHARTFRAIGFEGDSLRVYARVYTRDLYHYGLGRDEIQAMDTVFVLSIGTGNEDDDVYNQLRDSLGAFVETSVIDTDIEIDNQGA